MYMCHGTHVEVREWAGACILFPPRMLGVKLRLGSKYPLNHLTSPHPIYF